MLTFIKKAKKYLIFIFICLTVFAFWSYNFVKVNKEWPATEITKISPLEQHEINGVEYTILQSVIAPPKTALQHYGLAYKDISDNKLNPMYDAGWECKVLAVQIKLKNITDKPLFVTKCFLESAETTSWSNGLSSMILNLFNPGINTKIIEPQGELVVIYPYYLYPNHFNSSDWKALDKKRFYLVSNILYPEKIEFDCMPIFL